VVESGASDIYTIQVSTEPIEDIIIEFTVTGNCELDLDEIVITSDNWEDEHTVTVTAIDDDSARGAQSCTVSHTISSDDSEYDDLETSSIEVSITDDDSAGVIVEITDNDTSVTLGGETDTFTVELASAPANPVSIQIVTGDDIATIPARIVFSTDNWDTPQEVEVGTFEDVENLNATIFFQVSSQDSDYNNIEVDNVEVRIIDDLPEESDDSDNSDDSDDSEEDSLVTANAGRNRSVSLGDSIILNGTNSSGSNLTFSWEITAGPGTLSSANTSQPVYLSTAGGETTIQLTVSDGINSDIDTMTITSVNQARIGVNRLDQRVVAVMDDTGHEIIETVNDSEIILSCHGFTIRVPLIYRNTYRVSSTADGKLVLTFPSDNKVFISEVAESELTGEIDLTDDEVFDSGNDQFLVRIAPENLDESCEFGTQIQSRDVNSDGVYELMISSRCFGEAYNSDGSIFRSISGGTTSTNQSFTTTENNLVIGPEQRSNDKQLEFSDPEDNSSTGTNEIMVFSQDNIKDSEEDLDRDNADIVVSFDNGELITNFAVGDIDGDENDDLVLYTDGYVIYVYLNINAMDPNLTQDNVSYMISGCPEAVSFGYSLVIDDVTGDGINDVVMGAPLDGDDFEGVIYVLQLADLEEDATFDEIGSIQVNGPDGLSMIGTDMVIYDEDEDGVNDIYTVDSGSITMIINIGTGSESEENSDDSTDSTSNASSGGGGGGCSLNDGNSSTSAIILFGLIFMAGFLMLRRKKKAHHYGSCPMIHFNPKYHDLGRRD
jgi:hypothetical protein